MDALGMVELNSISQGILAADAILKAANVSIVKAQPVCPGKYVVIVNGSVADVKSAVEAGSEAAQEHLLDSMIIPRVHDDVVRAMSGCVDLEGVEALGVIETYSLAQALISADAAAKAADVALMEVRLATGLGGKSFVLLTGSISAAKAAVEAGVAERANDGMVVSSVVVPSPHPELKDAIQ